jgi:hypothetical protein
MQTNTTEHRHVYVYIYYNKSTMYVSARTSTRDEPSPRVCNCSPHPTDMLLETTDISYLDMCCFVLVPSPLRTARHEIAIHLVFHLSPHLFPATRRSFGYAMIKRRVLIFGTIYRPK